MPALPPFRRRRPWVTGDLQTVRNLLPGRPPGVAPGAGERIVLALRDGSGDRLAARLHPGEGRGPLVVLVHGLTGCEDSAHVLQSAAAWLAEGHEVVRLNLRGAPPGRSLARGHYHMDRVSDLGDACAALAGLRPGAAAKGIVLVGFSLGGALAVRLAGAGAVPDSLRGVVAISAPFDLEATSRRMSRLRNLPYERWLLARLRKDSEPLWRSRPAETGAALARARSIREFDDVLTAPEAGFRDATDYYASCSPLRSLPALRVPVLALHADDDPWVPPPPADAAGNGRLQVAVTRGGGHVGFHGRGGRVPWHVRAAMAFVAREAGG